MSFCKTRSYTFMFLFLFFVWIKQTDTLLYIVIFKGAELGFCYPKTVTLRVSCFVASQIKYQRLATVYVSGFWVMSAVFSVILIGQTWEGYWLSILTFLLISPTMVLPTAVEKTPSRDNWRYKTRVKICNNRRLRRSALKNSCHKVNTDARRIVNKLKEISRQYVDWGYSEDGIKHQWRQDFVSLEGNTSVIICGGKSWGLKAV